MTAPCFEVLQGGTSGHITSDRKQHRTPDLFGTDGTKRTTLREWVCTQVIDGDDHRSWHGAGFREVEVHECIDGSHTDRHAGVWAEVKPRPE